MIVIQRPFDCRFYSPVVPVNPLTDRSIERNKVGRAEDQCIFGNADPVGLARSICHKEFSNLESLQGLWSARRQQPAKADGRLTSGPAVVR